MTTEEELKQLFEETSTHLKEARSCFEAAYHCLCELKASKKLINKSIKLGAKLYKTHEDLNLLKEKINEKVLNQK